jgi:isocitrate dehydrogenase (NAD+)
LTHCVLIPGDGVGPEVTDAARRAVAEAGAEIEWEVRDAHDPGLVDAIRACGVALKGPVAATPGRRSPNLILREELDLVLGVRPSRDVVVARMLAEDLYAGREADPSAVGLPQDAGVSLKFFTPDAVRRAARFAFDWAERAGRRRVTIVHKASVMHASDGLFLRTAREVETPLEVDDRLVDAICHDLAAGREYDVLFCGMLYGDLLSDLAAGLTGGLGWAPGANYGDGVAVFEPVHGTALRRVGNANPAAMILSAAMLLRHVGQEAPASVLEALIAQHRVDPGV